MAFKDIKQVIVMRTKYPNGEGGLKKIRKGKMCSQAAHASMKVLFDMMSNAQSENIIIKSLDMEIGSPLEKWVNGKFTKITLQVESEEELDELYDKAVELGLPCSMIVDEGLTEFDGVPTKTCIAIGPEDGRKIDEVTKGLRLL